MGNKKEVLNYLLTLKAQGESDRKVMQHILVVYDIPYTSIRRIFLQARADKLYTRTACINLALTVALLPVWLGIAWGSWYLDDYGPEHLLPCYLLINGCLLAALVTIGYALFIVMRIIQIRMRNESVELPFTFSADEWRRIRDVVLPEVNKLRLFLYYAGKEGFFLISLVFMVFILSFSVWGYLGKTYILSYKGMQPLNKTVLYTEVEDVVLKRAKSADVHYYAFELPGYVEKFKWYQADHLDCFYNNASPVTAIDIVRDTVQLWLEEGGDKILDVSVNGKRMLNLEQRNKAASSIAVSNVRWEMYMFSFMFLGALLYAFGMTVRFFPV